MRNSKRSSRLYAGGILMLLQLAGPGLRAQQEGEKLLVRVSAGNERQDFRWSIAGNSAGQDPNVYSELKWHGVNGPAARVEVSWKPVGRWRVLASGSRVFVRSGSMTDTDYGLDNRNDPIYHQQFGVTAGHDFSLGALVGYSLLSIDRFQLSPYLGYGYEEQNFPVTDPGGPYEGLNSSYDAKWLGPLLRVETAWQLSGRWQVVADVTYHQVRYHATADWNLVMTFAQPVSFRHTADGYGVEADAGLRYKAGRRMAIVLCGGYFNWQTGTGIDQLYLSAGGSDETQLNGVVREGWKAMLAVEIGLW